ncbi:MAG: hypothetical protein LBR85_05375, partial [Oscillospiraceae bacterium]|nr:hypothetical protein [Oscillospiraceae bacterium]
MRREDRGQFYKRNAPTGPTGPTGAAVATAYDPSKTSTYQPGQIIMGSDGKPYVVTQLNPTGTPGQPGSTGYAPLTGTAGATGPTGPTGAAASVTYDPNMASSYVKDQLIYYNGDLYTANSNSPTGTPGTAGSGYTQLTNSSRVGRDVGSTVPAYNPVDSATYIPGQLVTYRGQLYQVLNTPATGTPDSSPNYRNLSGAGATGATGAGVTGPTGPTGAAIATTFNPNNTSTYQPGQIIMGPDGKPYVVTQSNPTGTPGQPGSTGYAPLTGTAGATGPTGGCCTGPTGPTGAAASATYDPNKAATYVKDQLIYYNGDLYTANSNSPTGTPGTAGSGYTQLTNSSRVGRDVGSTVPAYSPVDSATYIPGQLVTYNGQLYQVLNTPATGTPDSSPNYRNLSGAGPTGATGVAGAGVTGPTGPTGAAIATTFNPNNTSTYQPGQIIMGPDGKPYVVTQPNPTGTPGQPGSTGYAPLTGSTG